MELWTMQTYYTGNYYCVADSSICIHLLVQYRCGGVNGEAYPLDYWGCMVRELHDLFTHSLCYD